jgi:hypothetical protein
MPKRLSSVTASPPASSGPPRLAPARSLGQHGHALWDRVTASYAVDDIGGQEMLLTACIMLDRAEALRQKIDNDGAVLRLPDGLLKSHPCLKDELAAFAFVSRTLQRLGLDVEPLGRVGRPAR